MADIDVERKAATPIWIWIVGLLLLALLIWAIASMMRRDDRPAAMVTDTPAVVAPAEQPGAPVGAAALPAAAQTFMQDCHLEEGARTEGMGLDHDFTVNCLEHLANSLEGLAQQRPADPNINQHVETIRERANQIRQSDPASTEHARWTREAADAGANALEAMHQTWHAGDQQLRNEVSQVRQAAQQIDPADLHLEQLTDLRSYFRRAGDAMNSIAQRQQT